MLPLFIHNVAVLVDLMQHCNRCAKKHYVRLIVIIRLPSFVYFYILAIVTKQTESK